MLEDGKKGNNMNKNEVFCNQPIIIIFHWLFCNPSQSSMTLVNGKGPTTNNEKEE
jgi:hypothetical protein